MQIFEKTLRPLLEEFSLSYQLFVTQRALEAQDYLSRIENLCEKYSAIVIVSGDGLLFEVIQGLFQRPDNKFNVPLAIVPGGSGNGLAKSLSYYNGETSLDLFSCCLNAVAKKKSSMDLIKVTTQSGKEVYSFLSIGWGFTSDTDIESECLRCLVSALTINILKKVVPHLSIYGTTFFKIFQYIHS